MKCWDWDAARSHLCAPRAFKQESFGFLLQGHTTTLLPNQPEVLVAVAGAQGQGMFWFQGREEAGCRTPSPCSKLYPWFQWFTARV